MNKRYKSIFLIFLLSGEIEARNFKLFVDEQGVDSNLPIEVTNNLMFEIGYYSNKESEIKDFDRTNREGKKGSKIDESNLFLSLKYNVTKIASSNIFVGLEYEKFTRENEQIGYYGSNASQFPFNNSVKLKGEKFNIISEAVYGGSSDRWRAYLRGTLTPRTKLDVEQKTKIFPKLSSGGDYKGDATFNLSYKVEGEVKWNMGRYIDVGVGGSYTFIPYEYQLKVVNDKRDGYVEKTQNYDEKTKEYFVKIRLKEVFDDNVLPTIGYKWLEIEDNKIKNSESHEPNRNFVFVGIEKWF